MNLYGMRIWTSILTRCNYHYCHNSELYEAERWHSENRLWTPMTILHNGQHIFIGDIVDINNSSAGKIVKFIEVCHQEINVNYKHSICIEKWGTSSNCTWNQIWAITWNIYHSRRCYHGFLLSHKWNFKPIYWW